MSVAVPQQTTWVWPEAHTYPEERQVLDSYPVIEVTITTVRDAS